jgi:uncharacterized protein
MAEHPRAALMRIQVGSLSNGFHTYHFEAAGSDLGLAENFRHPVSVDVTLNKEGTQVFLRASVSTKAQFVCDRCLREFSGDVTPNYHVYFVSDPSEGEQFDPSEVQVLSPALNVIDIAEDVRETVLLAVPLKLLCNENCKGLCPTCGANRNVEPCDCRDDAADPRWEKLKNFNNDLLKH